MGLLLFNSYLPTLKLQQFVYFRGRGNLNTPTHTSQPHVFNLVFVKSLFFYNLMATYSLAAWLHPMWLEAILILEGPCNVSIREERRPDQCQQGNSSEGS